MNKHSVKQNYFQILIPISLALIFLFSCKDGSVNNPNSASLTFQTDKSTYYFSTSTLKDTIWCNVYNGTDSPIEYWFPAARVAIIDSTGKWKIIPVTSMLGLNSNPIKPGETFKSFVFMYEFDDSIFIPGVYSFYGDANWNGLVGESTTVQSNSFTVSIK